MGENKSGKQDAISHKLLAVKRKQEPERLA